MKWNKIKPKTKWSRAAIKRMKLFEHPYFVSASAFRLHLSVEGTYKYTLHQTILSTWNWKCVFGTHQFLMTQFYAWLVLASSSLHLKLFVDNRTIYFVSFPIANSEAAIVVTVTVSQQHPPLAIISSYCFWLFVQPKFCWRNLFSDSRKERQRTMEKIGKKCVKLNRFFSSLLSST